MTQLQFTDSIDDTFNTLREIIGGLPRPALMRAQKAAQMIEHVVEQIKRDNKTDPAAGLGMAFAVFMIAQHMVQDNREASDRGEGLIQLLS